MSRSLRRRRALVFLAVLGICQSGLPAAIADDGILYYHGTPRLMHGDSNIRMLKEWVQAYIYPDRALVHCEFLFQNDGPDTVARIGFPDGSDHDGEEGEKPTPSLKGFRSAVDGKAIPMRVEATKNLPSFFHVKEVSFKRGQVRKVEDWYRCELSGGGTDSLIKGATGQEENLYVSQFNYIMSSGGSWKGTIGEATVRIQFVEKKFRKLTAIPQSKTGNPILCRGLAKLPAAAVIWSGFATPVIGPNTLTFVRRKFKPTEKDDIWLTFDWLPYDKSHYAKSDGK